MSFEQIVCKTVKELLPNYSIGTSDSANQILSHLPDPARTITALHRVLDVLLPGKIGEIINNYDELSDYLKKKLNSVAEVLQEEIDKAIPFRWIGATARIEGQEKQDFNDNTAKDIVVAFFKRLVNIRKLLISDIVAAYKGDPAALTYAEIQLAYPGLTAILTYRLAHELNCLRIPIIPRIMTEHAHSITGVDIHPGATIGESFFIDHATGVVIGETTVIGKNVKIYQGVTLGAKSFPLDKHGNPVKHIKRHPTVEDEVVIYANSTILGGDTVIGHNSTIAGNVFLTHSVPANSFVVSEKREVVIKANKI